MPEHVITPPPGDSEGMIRVDGRRRTYLLHLPPTRTLMPAFSLVWVFHGGGGTGVNIAATTGFSALADQEGFAVVYPDGWGKRWNDGRDAANPVDDVAFVTALLAHLQATLSIDPARLYATGFSNGAMFCQRLGWDMANTFAALGAVAGTLAVNIVDTTAAVPPLPLLMIHGTDDSLVLWEGGFVLAGYVMSVPETLAQWIARNSCRPTPDEELLPNGDQADNTRVWREVYTPTRGAHEVMLYGIAGGGHTWPDALEPHPEERGRTTHDINATYVLWKFFAAHAQEASAGRK